MEYNQNWLKEMTLARAVIVSYIWKNSCDFNGIQIHDLRDAGAVL